MKDQFSPPLPPRGMPLSTVTQSTKTALDPFVCFIYSDCSQQLTWDSVYPHLPLLIDPFSPPFNDSATTWKNGVDLKSDTLQHTSLIDVRLKTHKQHVKKNICKKDTKVMSKILTLSPRILNNYPITLHYKCCILVNLHDLK